MPLASTMYVRFPPSKGRVRGCDPSEYLARFQVSTAKRLLRAIRTREEHVHPKLDYAGLPMMSSRRMQSGSLSKTSSDGVWLRIVLVERFRDASHQQVSRAMRILSAALDFHHR